jgi:hypothetical protein
MGLDPMLNAHDVFMLIGLLGILHLPSETRVPHYSRPDRQTEKYLGKLVDWIESGGVFAPPIEPPSIDEPPIEI